MSGKVSSKKPAPSDTAVPKPHPPQLMNREASSAVMNYEYVAQEYL